MTKGERERRLAAARRKAHMCGVLQRKLWAERKFVGKFDGGQPYICFAMTLEEMAEMLVPTVEELIKYASTTS